MRRVVMICSGNICRSPMAAVLGQRLLGPDDLVISAGTLGIHGQPAATHAQRAVAEVGLSLDGHRSQGVSLPILRAADHLVVMSPEHEVELRRRDPSAEDKVVRLWEHTRAPGRLREIADPVGQDYAAFVRCRDDLDECLRVWVASLG